LVAIQLLELLSRERPDVFEWQQNSTAIAARLVPLQYLLVR